VTADLATLPSLEYLKNLAKELLRAARDGAPDGIATVRAVPRLAGLDDEALRAAVRLADAQHAIARQCGQPSWPKLVRAVEAAQTPERQAEALLHAIRERRDDVPRVMLGLSPRAAEHDAFTAAATGRPRRLAALLSEDPTRATARHQPDQWTPLIYAAASPLFAGDAAAAAGIVRCAEMLLDAGADPNESTMWDGGDVRSPIPALYWACVGNHVALARLLLERGADPNDGESVYHAAERDHRECLELLRAHGCNLSEPHATWGNTPLYFLAGWKEPAPMCATATRGMQWLLEHGADPDVPSGEQRETPLHKLVTSLRGRDVLAMFLDHGAAVDQEREDGRTAYVLAVRTGNAPAADLLRERGADVGRLRPVDALLGAAMAADEPRARAVLAAHPGLLATLTDEEHQMVALAAEEGRVDVVRVLRDLGFDLAWEGPWGGTPLHHAAWHGKPEMVRFLLELGAPVNVRDKTYGSSPLGWAAHGSKNSHAADDDYCAIVEMLIAAGADRETSFNRWGEPPENLGTRRVAAVLRRHGMG